MPRACSRLYAVNAPNASPPAAAASRRSANGISVRSGSKDQLDDLAERPVVADVPRKDHVGDRSAVPDIQAPEPDAVDERAEDEPAARAKAVPGGDVGGDASLRHDHSGPVDRAGDMRQVECDPVGRLERLRAWFPLARRRHDGKGP